MTSGRRIEKHPDGSSTIYAGDGVEPVHVSARRPDGTATITAKGMQYTLSPEEVDQLVRKWNPRHFHELDAQVESDDIAVMALASTTKVYDTVKDLMQSPDREGVLETFKMVCELIEKGRWIGQPDAGPDVAETILEYPKIIAEAEFPASMQDMSIDSIKREFVDVGEIKLPFPRITVIQGAHVAADERLKGQLVSISDEVPGVNSLTCYFLMQAEDKVRVEFVTANPLIISNHPKGKLQIASLLLYIKDGSVKIGAAPNVASQVLAKQMSADNFGNMLKVIYMMTHPGGDFMMSKPTPHDIAVNKKRMRNNKKPLIEFKLITIDGKKKDTLPSIPHGTHASPRQHWRRGHYRHYASGKVVFVDPMLVGDAKNGKIIKDYAVGNYDEKRVH